MKILAVMVLYNQEIASSMTYQSFKSTLANFGSENVLSLMIYDNSPLPQDVRWLPSASITYVHDTTNAGLAKAYNHALDTAVASGCEWLLLLDQDTSIPGDFIANLIENIVEIGSDESVVAVVPRVECLGETVSPSIIKFGCRFRPVDAKAKGLSLRAVTSINSGTVLRISFMQLVGGFNTLFRLDYLDHWIFSTIYSYNKRVFISKSVLKHELSIMDYDKWMNPERYEGILKSERLYLCMCRPRYEKYFYIAHLIKRIKDQLFDRNKQTYLKKTFRALKQVFLNDNDCGKLH